MRFDVRSPVLDEVRALTQLGGDGLRYSAMVLFAEDNMEIEVMNMLVEKMKKKIDGQ